MKIICGLGNPGQKYKNTWHNLGFMVIDEFAEKNNFPDFSLLKKFNALIAEGNFERKKTLLIKPQTFMNNSGQSLKKLVDFYKIEKESLIVVHDEIDLPFGQIKISKEKSSAGHKGVESIIQFLGTKDFIRLRIGILPLTGKPKNPEKFVLQDFKKDERKEIVKRGCKALQTIISEGLEKAMNEYN